MKHRKLLIMVAAVGLIGTSAAVGANGLISKVSGVLDKGAVISINGENTDLHPVYIDGKAYIPARDAGTALGYSVIWNSAGNRIEFQSEEEVAADYVKIQGVIVDASSTDDEGRYRIEVLGSGMSQWIILYVVR